MKRRRPIKMKLSPVNCLYPDITYSTTSHLNVVKKIFKYLKGQPKLGLWYPKDSPFPFGKPTCKKQTIVTTSSTEAEYVTAASCCAQVVNTAASSMDSADGSVFMLVGILLLVDSFLLIGTSIYAAELVFAGSILFLLAVTCFCCLHLVSAVLSLILLVGWSLPLVTSFLLVVSNHAGVTMYLLNE
ncbi:hypothetical protein Tco_0968279 [Tanacetum coccineum]